jgi:uncharacterized membrane protein YhaH (DUF805 family)
VLGLTGNPDKWTMLDYLLGGIIFTVSMWFLIELGFFRGTPGPNRYGPDPLAEQR